MDARDVMRELGAEVYRLRQVVGLASDVYAIMDDAVKVGSVPMPAQPLDRLQNTLDELVKQAAVCGEKLAAMRPFVSEQLTREVGEKMAEAMAAGVAYAARAKGGADS